MRLCLWISAFALIGLSSDPSSANPVAQSTLSPPQIEVPAEKTPSRFLMGIQGGMVLGNGSYTPEITTDAVSNPGFGYVAEWELSRLFSISAELNYLKKGAIYSQLNLDYTDTYSMLSLPLHIRFKPLSFFKIFRLYIEAGPEVAYRLSDNQKQEDFIFNSGSTEGRVSGTRDWTFGVQGGIGFEAWVKRSVAVFFTARYSQDLTEASKDSTNDTAGRIKLSAWEFFLGPKVRI